MPENCALCGETIDRIRNAKELCGADCCACHRLMPSQAQAQAALINRDKVGGRRWPDDGHIPVNAEVYLKWNSEGRSVPLSEMSYTIHVGSGANMGRVLAQAIRTALGE